MPAENNSGEDRLFLADFRDDVLTITPLGDVDSLRWQEVEQASKAIFFELLSVGSGSKVLVDMSNVRFCGSSMLSFMVRVWRSLHSQRGTLALCNVSPDVAGVLKQTRLDTLWPTFASREEAYTGLSSKKEGSSPESVGEKP